MNRVVNRRMIRVRRGFTLLEIMLVVGLLALLAAGVIPALIERSKNAKIDLARSQVGPNGSLSTTIEQYKLDTDTWPETLKDLSEKPSDELVASKWRGPYIKNPDSMKDPWQNDFNYEGGGSATHNETQFDLWSNGPDMTSGTDDDITNWKKE